MAFIKCHGGHKIRQSEIKMHRREVRYSVRGDINVYREEWLTQLKRMVNEIQNLLVCTNMTHGKGSADGCQSETSLNLKGNIKESLSFSC